MFIYELKEWIKTRITPTSVNVCNLSRNINAIHFLEKYPEYIDWEQLSGNPNAIHLLEKYIEDDGDTEALCWRRLSNNPNAISLLEKHQNRIKFGYLTTNPSIFEKKMDIKLLTKWLERDETEIEMNSKIFFYELKDWISVDDLCRFYLCDNINAFDYCNKIYNQYDRYGFWDHLVLNSLSDINALHLLKQNPHKIYWSSLSEIDNIDALYLLEKNQDKINWERLSGNKHINAIRLLEKNQDKIDWERLSGNINAIHLLEKNQDKINWEHLSGNKNAIHLLEENEDKIHWSRLSGNINAIHLLEKNQKIDWYELFQNPGIFEKKQIHPSTGWLEIEDEMHDF
jgi:hypothetical protein